MTPQPMSDAEIADHLQASIDRMNGIIDGLTEEDSSDCDPDLIDYARAILAARDAQWREMLGEPVAWARAWHIAKETPKKERNANGNLAWPFKYKLLAVTPRKAMFDDSPLYAIKETP